MRLMKRIPARDSVPQPNNTSSVNPLLLAQPFRRDANSKVHNIVEYLDSMSEIRKMKMPEMTRLFPKLIARTKWNVFDCQFKILLMSNEREESSHEQNRPQSSER
jgi:hypothetical protein